MDRLLRAPEAERLAGWPSASAHDMAAKAVITTQSIFGIRGGLLVNFRGVTANRVPAACILVGEARAGANLSACSLVERASNAACRPRQCLAVGRQDGRLLAVPQSRSFSSRNQLKIREVRPPLPNPSLARPSNPACLTPVQAAVFNLLLASLSMPCKACQSSTNTVWLFSSMNRMGPLLVK